MKPVDGWDLVAELVWHPLGMVPYPWLLMSIRRHGVDMPLNALVEPLEEDGLVTRFYLPTGEWFMPGPVALADAGMVAPESPPPFWIEDFDMADSLPTLTTVKRHPYGPPAPPDLTPAFEALPWASPTAAVILDMNGTTEQWPDLSEPSFFPAAIDTLGLIEREYLPTLPDPGMAHDLAGRVLLAPWLSWPKNAARIGEEMREHLPGPGGMPLTPINATLTGWILSDGLFRSGREMAIRGAHPSDRKWLAVAGRKDICREMELQSRWRMEEAARGV